MDTRTFVRTAPLAAALTLAAALGCTDRLGTQPDDTPDTDTLLESLEAGIHPVLHVAGRSAESVTLELGFRRVDVESGIASVQGELRYDAELLELAGAEIARGITGAWHEVEPGTVRFAGVALDGLDDRAVLTLSFTEAERGRGVRAESFHLAVEEIVGTEAFHDLAPELRHPEAHPLLIHAAAGGAPSAARARP